MTAAFAVHFEWQLLAFIESTYQSCVIVAENDYAKDFLTRYDSLISWSCKPGIM